MYDAKHQRSRLNFSYKKVRLKTVTNAQLSKNKTHTIDINVQ